MYRWISCLVLAFCVVLGGTALPIAASESTDTEDTTLVSLDKGKGKGKKKGGKKGGKKRGKGKKPGTDAGI